jgi:molybdopterin molybdotransferase
VTGEPSIGELSVEDARARMLAATPPLRTETVPLADALGRTLAEPITAVRDQPPFDASAMDGWAIRSDAAPGLFNPVGESAAGAAFAWTVEAGEAVRIFTGAPVPQGCRVVVQEASEREGEAVRLDFAAEAPRYVRRRGGDFAAGDVLLAAGMRLDPWRLALAAAAGRGAATVAARPFVAILPTGEEVVPAGTIAGLSQIFDSGGPALAALVAGWGGAATLLPPAGDREADILAALHEAREAELVVTVGGASVGDHDLVKPTLAKLGLKLIVDTVKMRPGKPVWFGVLADGRRVLGLPGNPASALVCAELFLRPLTMAWQGADASVEFETARLAAPLPKGGPREHWMRGALSSRDGVLSCEAFPDQESSLVSVFARADCLIRRPIGAPPAEAGDVVDVLRLGRL